MSSPKHHTLLFYVLLTGVTILFLYTISSFLYAIFWAAILAIIFMPVYDRLEARLHRPNLSASLALVLVILVILIPSAILGSMLVAQSLQMYETFNTAGSGAQQSLQNVIDFANRQIARTGLPLDQQYWLGKFSDVARNIAQYIFSSLTALTQNVFIFIVHFVAMLYALFFFFRDGDMFLRAALHAIHLDEDREVILYERFASTARATLKVTLIIGGIQGAMGGIIFSIAGIQGSLVWATVMMLMAMIPVLGSFVVWAPAGLIMLVNGNIWEAVLILASGGLVISNVDNFLRPIILGRDVNLHALLIFLSTLGGIGLFGVTGFIIGPIITSLLLVLWQMYWQFYQD